MDWKKITLSQWASIATTILFAVGTFYLALAQLWNLPYGDEINGTFNALAGLIGSILGAFTMKKVGLNNESRTDL